MANNNIAFSDTFSAGADLSSSQYLFVELSSANTVTVANSAGEKTVGVLLNDPTSGQAANVAILGRVKVIASAAISVNAYVSTTNAGKAVTASTGHYAIGRAVTASTADGEYLEVLLTGPVIAP
jgi:hypothetical protein